VFCEEAAEDEGSVDALRNFLNLVAVAGLFFTTCALNSEKERSRSSTWAGKLLSLEHSAAAHVWSSERCR
jgi:hypothetical protein